MIQSTGVIQTTAIQSMGYKPVTACELSVMDSMMRSVQKLKARAKKLLQKFDIARTSMRMILSCRSEYREILLFSKSCGELYMA